MIRPSERDGMAIDVPLIWPSGKAKYFLFWGLTRFRQTRSDLPPSSLGGKPTLLVGDYFFVAKYPYGYTHYSLPFSPRRGQALTVLSNAISMPIAAFTCGRAWMRSR